MSEAADGASSDDSGAVAEFFEALYQGTAAGEVTLPWDRLGPHPVLVDWAERSGLTGGGRRAVVVGCGLGADAEFVAGLGFDTVAFDVSQTAIDLARRQNPDSAVAYTTADLLNLPKHWLRAYDLVVEIYTAQALPDPLRAGAIINIGRLVAPGGTLLAVAFVGEERKTGGFPPWPLTRSEIDDFATDGLVPVAVERTANSGSPAPGSGHDQLWRAEFRRPDDGT